LVDEWKVNEMNQAMGSNGLAAYSLPQQIKASRKDNSTF